MTPSICLISRPDLVPTIHGAAVKIMRTAEALSRLGARVFIVTNDRLWFYEAVEGLVNRRRYPQVLLSLTNLPPALKAKLLAARLPSYWQALEALLHRLGYPTDEHFLYQPLVDLDFWLRVLYVGWTHRIHVYQAEFPGYAVPAVIAARLLGGQSALVEHNVEHKRLADTTDLEPATLARLRRIEAACARAVDHVIAVSEPDRELLLKDGVEDHRIAVIPHGVELESYQRISGAGIRARYRIPEDVPLLVFHGTLHYWPNTIAVKHIAEDLLPRLERAGQKVKVMICGMNPPRYYAHPDIVFTDVVQDLPQHLKAADLAVVPLDDGGGTRLKILEYFAAGIPVVSTPKGAEGIPARHGETILLAEQMEDFTQAVLTLLRTPQEARRIGLAGQTFVQSYSWDALCSRYLSLYGFDSKKKTSEHPEALTAPPAPAQHNHTPAPAQNNHTSGAPHTSGSQYTREAQHTHNRDSRGAVLGPFADSPALRGITEHLPGAITPTKPLTMIMMINRGCNLRCEFCDLYENPERLEGAHVYRILEEAASLGVKTVVFTGGEPFLHGDLWEMIRRARALGLGTNVTTNGTLIEKHLSKLVDAGISSVSVSLDGLEETHEALRKIKGCHEKTLQGIKLLQRHGIPTNIYFVVTGQNVGELVPVYELAQSLGCGFDFWPVNDAHQLYLITPEHRSLYRQAIDTLAARDPAVAAKRDYYYAGLDYHAGWDKHLRCLGLIEQFGVNLQGELVPCCVWDNTDLTVGSLKEHGLASLWFGEQAQTRRRQIFEQGCHNRCFNHSLYEFQLSTGLSFVVGGQS